MLIMFLCQHSPKCFIPLSHSTLLRIKNAFNNDTSFFLFVTGEWMEKKGKTERLESYCTVWNVFFPVSLPFPFFHSRTTLTSGCRWTLKWWKESLVSSHKEPNPCSQVWWWPSSRSLLVMTATAGSWSPTRERIRRRCVWMKNLLQKTRLERDTWRCTFNLTSNGIPMDTWHVTNPFCPDRKLLFFSGRHFIFYQNSPNSWWSSNTILTFYV